MTIQRIDERRRRGASTGLPAISLFSGVGGLDLGVHRAGFDVRAAVEYDADSAASLRINQFPDDPGRVIQRSILDVSTAEILERSQLRQGEAALVVGGPPCTPFSKSGYWLEYKRKGLDPDASLLDEYARVVREARPAAALLENVHGLAYQNHNRGPFSRLLKSLAEAGYETNWLVLNAADYGVPQLRKRLFVYATRDATPPVFPAPTHSGWTETQRRVDNTLLPYVTSRQAIGDLESRDDLAEPDEAVGGKYGSLLPDIPPGDNYLFYTAHRDHPSPLFQWRSRYWTFLLKLDPDRPATTIQSQPGPYIGPFHWQNRRLRLPEIMRLQTFPDDYQLIGSRRSAQSQIGNAVPPDLAEIVARPLAEMLALTQVHQQQELVAAGVA
jgi:DNA (cytosine-5)-methyltransferase 1